LAKNKVYFLFDFRNKIVYNISYKLFEQFRTVLKGMKELKQTINGRLSQQGVVYQALRKRVIDGVYGEDGKLPSLRELAAEFRTSPGSARLALLCLEQEELLRSQNGIGYFVRSRNAIQRILLLEAGIHDHLFSNFFQAIQQKISEASSMVLLVESVDKCFRPEGADPSALLKKINLHLSSGLDACFFDGEKAWGITPDVFRGFSERTRMFYYMSAYPHFLEAGIPGVSVDWHAAGYMSAHHLLECGCRCVVCDFTPDTAFRQGVKDALNVSNYEVALYFTDPRAPLENSQSRSAFAMKKVDGYIAASDARVFNNLDFFKTCGYTCSDDLAMIGCYNTPWTTEFGMQLSSLDVRPEIQIEMVWDMFTYRRPAIQAVLPPVLVKRDSTMNFKPKNWPL